MSLLVGYVSFYINKINFNCNYCWEVSKWLDFEYKEHLRCLCSVGLWAWPVSDLPLQADLLCPSESPPPQQNPASLHLPPLHHSLSDWAIVHPLCPLCSPAQNHVVPPGCWSLRHTDRCCHLARASWKGGQLQTGNRLSSSRRCFDCRTPGPSSWNHTCNPTVHKNKDM